MKKMIRRLSLVLALILCFSVCCAGLASAESADSAESGESGESTGDNTEMFMAIMQLIPGLDQIDWEGFAKDFEAKKASGAEITLEDCLPAGAWTLFGSMQFIDENGKIPEDLPMTIDVQVTGNEMISVYTMKEQADEDNAKAIAESVAATFETQEAMQNLKTSMEEMTGSGIDVNKVVMGIRYLNADGSVIYEKSYTYEDLTKALEPAA